MTMSLHASRQRQNQHDDQDHSEKSGGAVTPAAAVGPARNRADQKQDQDNEQDSAEHGRPLRLGRKDAPFRRKERPRGGVCSLPGTSERHERLDRKSTRLNSS